MKFKGLKKVTSKTADTSQWLVPTFTDEFSGSALSANWNYRGFLYEPDSLRECSKGDPSAVKVSGGVVQLSVIKDPETYERFEKVVLVHGCRQVQELAYGETITETLPNHELIGELVREIREGRQESDIGAALPPLGPT